MQEQQRVLDNKEVRKCLQIINSTYDPNKKNDTCSALTALLQTFHKNEDVVCKDDICPVHSNFYLKIVRTLVCDKCDFQLRRELDSLTIY